MRARLALLVLLVAVAASACASAAANPSSSVVQPGDAAEGRALYESRNCSSCHSTDGSRGVGPTWQSLAGSTETLTDGTTVVVDAAYVEASIREPAAQIVSGYEVVQMPQIELTDQEIQHLVAYIESLSMFGFQ